MTVSHHIKQRFSVGNWYRWTFYLADDIYYPPYDEEETVEAEYIGYLFRPRRKGDDPLSNHIALVFRDRAQVLWLIDWEDVDGYDEARGYEPQSMSKIEPLISQH